MESLIQRLEAQQTRLRNLFILNGSLHLLLRALILAVILFFLDYAVDPPLGMRITMTLLALGYMVYTGFRCLVYPLSRHFSRGDIALAMERTFSDLDGDLISVLQFHESGEVGRRSCSPDLVKAAMAYGSKKAEGLSWEGLFDTRRLKKLLLATLAVFLLVSGYGLTNADLAGIWLQRMAGGTVEWPRRTTLRIHLEEAAENYRLLTEADPLGPQEVLLARGTSLPVRVEAVGRDPGGVEVVYETEAQGRIAAQATRRGTGQYHYRFRNVRENMRFWVQGGDDPGHGRYVDVSVLIPPEILSVRCDYRYPEYLGIEPERKNTAQIEGPEGTEVEAHFTLSKPVKEAAMAFRSDQGEETIPLEGDGDNLLELSHRFRLERSGTYQVRLKGDEGFTNRDAALHSIIVRKDMPPRVRQYFPQQSDLDVAPRGVVVFIAVAEDDYGVAGMRLLHKPAGEEDYAAHDYDAGETDQPYGTRRIVAGHVMDLESTRFEIQGAARLLGPGDAVYYTIEALDARPDRETGSADTGRHVLNVVSENEKIRILTERQIRMKERVRSIRVLQGERIQKMETNLEALETSGGGEQRIVSMQIAQNQLTNQCRDVTREMAYIYDEYLFNRFDRTSAAAVLLDQAVSLRLAARVSESFDPKVYQDLMEFHTSGQLGEMDQMERLSIMLSLCLTLSEVLSPEAAGFLAKAVVVADPSEAPDLIRQSLEIQRRMLAVLDLLLDKMDEWEDYQELIQLFRDMIDSQYNLNIMTREELKKRR